MKRLYKSKDNSLITIGLATILILFAPLLSLHIVPINHDYSYINLPLRHFLSEQLKNGFFPLWSPHIYAGAPIFAEGQMGTFYPLNQLFLLLPYWAAGNLMIVLHYLLTFFFTFLYLRHLKLSSFAAFFSGFSFSLGPGSLWLIGNLNVADAVIWLPLTFLLVELIVQRRKPCFSIALATILSVQFFAGYPPVAIANTLSCLLYFSCRIFSTKESHKAKVFLFISVALLLFAAFSLIQLIPTLELLTNSSRSISLPYPATTTFSIPPLLFFHHIFQVPVLQKINILFQTIPDYLSQLPLLLTFFPDSISQEKSPFSFLFHFWNSNPFLFVWPFYTYSPYPLFYHAPQSLQTPCYFCLLAFLCYLCLISTCSGSATVHTTTKT